MFSKTSRSNCLCSRLKRIIAIYSKDHVMIGSSFDDSNGQRVETTMIRPNLLYIRSNESLKAIGSWSNPLEWSNGASFGRKTTHFVECPIYIIWSNEELSTTMYWSSILGESMIHSGEWARFTRKELMSSSNFQHSSNIRANESSHSGL